MTGRTGTVSTSESLLEEDVARLEDNDAEALDWRFVVLGPGSGPIRLLC